MPSILERAIDFIESRKSGPVPLTVPSVSPQTIRAELEAKQKTAGEEVNRKTAVEVSAVLACARVIAEGLAQTSCKLLREDERGSLVEARDHYLFRLLNRRPNDWQTSFELREQIGLHLALDNNAYIFKNRVNDRVEELYCFTPESVEVVRSDDLTLSYKVHRPNQSAITVPAEDMWHIRGLSWNGYEGLNAVKLARRSIGLALATERYGSALFVNGAAPGGILTTRSGGAPITAEQRIALKEAWVEQHQGTSNAHKVVMLPLDLEYTSVGGSAQDAQWVESRKFLIEEICRFFRVRPIMVMQQGATSYASVEQELLAHLTHTLMPWFERFEQSAEANLLTQAEIDAGYTIKLNANALLRGSTEQRTTYYEKMVTLGVMTVNEVRAREDMPLSDDPEADKLHSAANLFGAPKEKQNNNEVNE